MVAYQTVIMERTENVPYGVTKFYVLYIIHRGVGSLYLLFTEHFPFKRNEHYYCIAIWLNCIMFSGEANYGGSCYSQICPPRQ